MTFNSLSYAIFLPLVCLAFRCTAERFRWLVLLLASYLFYASFRTPQLLLVLALVTVLSYAGALLIDRAPGEKARGRVFRTASLGLVAILALVKYLPAWSPLLGGQAGQPSAFSAIGVSYFTLQALSYLADVYLEVLEPERHPGYHALSLAFFPKLLQGPIERAGDLLPQLKAPCRFDYQRVRSGLVLFLWGLFLKVVIADRLSVLVNTVYDGVPASTPLSALVATYFFAVQLYCDFAGYTDMALGSALLFNIRLTANFNNPYLAVSVPDFWRRWHISFSRWILDYLFRPLQMRWRRGGTFGTACALLVTFLISGLWHGAKWGYLAWGGLHGAYLAASVYSEPWRKKLRRRLGIEQSLAYRCCRVFLTFHLVCFAWIFFRADSWADAVALIGKMGHFSFSPITIAYLRNTIGGLGMTQADMSIILLCLIFAALVAALDFRSNAFEKLFRSPLWVRWSFYVTLSLIVILLAQMEYVPYLYFQF